MEMQKGTAILEDSLLVPYKTKHILIIQSSSLLLGIYMNELKTYGHMKSFTQMFITAWFMIMKSQ